MASTAHTENNSRPGYKMPELLAPAGSFDKMVAAIHYGANAVYCGGKRFSLRAHASNFSEKELGEAVKYAHAKNVKLYVTVNIFAHQADLQGLEKYLQYLQNIGVDGVIVSDPGIFTLAKETIPGVPIHLSTQANVTNPANARFWEKQGAKRLNLARELSLSEISEIRKALQPATRIEIFVHGALCISYSGRCLLSCYFTGRDANRGECAQPCRYNYVLQEEKRPGQYFPVEEDGYGTYIFNSKDLCLLNKLPQLINIGVDSLKIEGRMKSVHYVGAVVRVYRAALDYIGAHIEEALKNNNAITVPSLYMKELMKVGTRGYTENFVFGPPGAEGMLYDRPRSDQEYVPVGVVQGVGNKAHAPNWFEIKVMNPLRKGETVEYLSREINSIPFTVTDLLDQDGIPLEQANPGSIVRVKHNPEFSIALEENCLLRKKNNP
jgi:putative protease